MIVIHVQAAAPAATRIMMMTIARHVPAVEVAVMNRMKTMIILLPAAAAARVAAVMAVGSVTLKPIRRLHAGDGKTPIMATAAGMAIRKPIRRLRAGDGKTPIMATAAGMAIRKAILKQPAAAGNTVIVASVAAAAVMRMSATRAAAEPVITRRKEGGSIAPSFSFRMANIAKAFWDGFWLPHASRKACIIADRKLREHLSERQIDKMVEDSVPASDPPSTY